MKLKPESKPKLKQPIVTALTAKHINEYKEKVKFNGGFLPFRTARQFSSIGRATSEQLSITGQRHEYFSELERKFGLALSFMSNVRAVKTQLPLINIRKTLQVAAELNVMHPRYKPSGPVSEENKGYQAAIITTDFVVDILDVETGEIRTVAYSLKYNEALEMFDGNDRVVVRNKDKLAIEKHYWENLKGIEFKITTDSFWALDKTLIENLSLARKHRNLELSQVLETSLLCHFIKSINFSSKQRFRLIDVIYMMQRETGLSEGRLYAVFWYFVWHKKLTVNLFKPLVDGGYIFNGKDFAWEM